MSNTPTTVNDIRNDILAALRVGICTVVFTKSDGERRTMRCTLLSEYLPVRPVMEENTVEKTPIRKKRDPKNIVVWDLDKGDWRSFNADTVVEWSSEYKN